MPGSNIQRALPPDPFRAKLRTDRVYAKAEETMEYEGRVVGRLQVQMNVGGVRVDDVYATIAIIMDGSRVPLCSGFAHGRSVTESAPIFIQEAEVLHALRVLREWIAPIDQRVIQFINIRAGGASANYQIREWMENGQCTMTSAAAAGVLSELHGD